jgi:hypothetical protein
MEPTGIDCGRAWRHSSYSGVAVGSDEQRARRGTLRQTLSVTALDVRAGADVLPFICPSRRAFFACCLSCFAKCLVEMPCVLENKLVMYSAMQEPFLLLHFTIEVSLFFCD